jgi:hypothetical protein
MAQVKEVRPPREAPLYGRDYALWVEEQVRLLQAGRFDQLDLPNLIDEVEDLVKSQRRAIRSDLVVVMLHLLKWQFQPERRSVSSQASIAEHRQRIEDEIEDSPSLWSFPAEVFAKSYARARQRAAIETALPPATFPESPPFTPEQALDPDFLPD